MRGYQHRTFPNPNNQDPKFHNFNPFLVHLHSPPLSVPTKRAPPSIAPSRSTQPSSDFEHQRSRAPYPRRGRPCRSAVSVGNGRVGARWVGARRWDQAGWSQTSWEGRAERAVWGGARRGGGGVGARAGARVGAWRVRAGGGWWRIEARARRGGARRVGAGARGVGVPGASRLARDASGLGQNVSGPRAQPGSELQYNCGNKPARAPPPNSVPMRCSSTPAPSPAAKAGEEV